MSLDYAEFPQKEISQYSDMSQSFYVDQIPSISSQYIFDDVYKSRREKQRFSNNRQFIYFNSLLKVKKKYENSSELYSQIFEKPKQIIISRVDRKNQSLDQQRKTPPYRVEKLNKHSFKIYKPVVSKLFSMEKPKESLLPVAGVTGMILSLSFQRPRTEKMGMKTDFKNIAAEYKRVSQSSRQKRDGIMRLRTPEPRFRIVSVNPGVKTGKYTIQC